MRYAVAIVVERDFGDELVSLAQRLHVWIWSTPENQRHIERARGSELVGAPLERGVTSFRSDSASPEDALLGILGTLDLHHGEYSHSPQWDTLEVYGASPSPPVREALAEFGVDTFSVTPRGFRCSRPEARTVSSPRAIRLAGAVAYAVLVFLGAAGLGFVVLPTLGYAGGLFAIEAEARGAFSLVTLEAVPFLVGLSGAAALSYDWLATLSIGRRVVVYCATALLVWLSGAAIAVFILG